MDALTEFQQNLLCPGHRTKLNLPAGFSEQRGVPFKDGDFTCSEGCTWRIERGIPRFVPATTYASGFGFQWQRYQKPQLDSYTGLHHSLERLERCLGGPIGMLRGKAVLECGSGAGRFTEHLLAECDALVSLDLSSAVEANLKTCAGRKPYLLVQADINQSPLPARALTLWSV